MCIIELQSSEHSKKQLGSFDPSLKRKTCVEVIRLKLLVVFGLLVAALVEHTHVFVETRHLVAAISGISKVHS